MTQNRKPYGWSVDQWEEYLVWYANHFDSSYRIAGYVVVVRGNHLKRGNWLEVLAHEELVSRKELALLTEE